MSNTTFMPASDLDFGNSPSFCKNGEGDRKGKIIHVSSDTTITGSGQADLSVTAGGILFKSDSDGSLSFYSDADFKAGFSRLLRNGVVVPLSEDSVIQLRRIHMANDNEHAGDISRRGLKSGVQSVKKLYRKALGTDAGLVALEQLDEAKQGLRDIRTEARGAAQEAMKDLSQTVDAISDSAIGKKARSTLVNAKRFLGALTNKT